MGGHQDVQPPQPAPGLPEHMIRFTRTGRKLRYQMTVIQQPAQARACGSGPKSSADRRPIDPPPLIEFKIFDETNPHESRDITLEYNTTFFCYAELEQAQELDERGVPMMQQNTPPVLTGMPVSSINYLDKPTPAGYFLFPDLSVRHEGKHQLRFSLYEEPKDEEDKDTDEIMTGADEIIGPNQRAVLFRMEVTSAPFQVFSAKRFPGLMSSTELSKTFAEQGCRVRVRREVRMRRRGDDKAKDEEEYSGRRRHDTPHQEIRARSSSNMSETRLSRRPSMTELAPSPSQYGLQTAAHGHLDFGRGANGNFAPPPMVGHYQPSAPSTPSYAVMPSPAFPHQAQPLRNLHPGLTRHWEPSAGGPPSIDVDENELKPAHVYRPVQNSYNLVPSVSNLLNKREDLAEMPRHALKAEDLSRMPEARYGRYIDSADNKPLEPPKPRKMALPPLRSPADRLAGSNKRSLDDAFGRGNSDANQPEPRKLLRSENFFFSDSFTLATGRDETLKTNYYWPERSAYSHFGQL